MKNRWKWSQRWLIRCQWLPKAGERGDQLLFLSQLSSGSRPSVSVHTAHFALCTVHWTMSALPNTELVSGLHWSALHRSEVLFPFRHIYCSELYWFAPCRSICLERKNTDKWSPAKICSELQCTGDSLLERGIRPAKPHFYLYLQPSNFFSIF